MEALFFGLIALVIIGVLLAALFAGGCSIFIVVGRLFNGVAGYFEQSFRYPLILRVEKNILVWSYIAVVAYLFFLVLFIDMNAAGVSARLSSDVINLRRISNSLMGAVAFLLNIPLIPLLWAKYPLTRDNRHLGIAWRLWKVMLWVILVALVLAVLSVSPTISAVIGKAFNSLYFWWNDVLIWLDADGQRTFDGFNYPAFQYVKRFLVDLLLLCAAYWPFALLHNSIWKDEESAINKETKLAETPEILPYD